MWQGFWRREDGGSATKTPRRNNSGFAFRSQDLGDKGIPVIKIANIQNKRVSPECADRLPEELCTGKLNRYFLRPEDTLIAMTGAGSVGKVGKMPSIEGRFLVNQRVAIVRPDSYQCDAAFVYYALSQDIYETKLYGLGLGAGQPNVSAKQIGELEVPFPPLPVQQRIAGILSAYDELIENSQRRIKILESMARALYREWFVHFRFPGHESVPRVPSPLGEIPQGWECASFAQAAIFENGDRGKNYPSGSDFVDEGIPFINARHLVDGAVDLANMNYILEEKFEQLRSGKIRKWDLLFCLRGSPGRTARTAGVTRGAIASSLVIIRPTERANEEFLYYTLAGEVGKQMAAKLNNGAAQPNVSVGSVQKYPLLLPPQEFLNKFAVLIEPIWGHVEVIRNQLSNLHKQRDLLLPRLLSGQIRMIKLGR